MLSHRKFQIRAVSGDAVDILIKIDTGYQRAGVKPDSIELKSIVDRMESTLELHPTANLCGLYSHAGHSYNESDRSDSMALLREELEGLERAAATINEIYRQRRRPARRFILSVGATPTATSIQGIEKDVDDDGTQSHHHQAKSLKSYLKDLAIHHEIEIHAGVYPILDLQQLATRTHRKPSSPSAELSTADLALTMLAEVVSIYPEREEALIAAGTLALGREPCKSYSGWGRITPWNTTTSAEAGWMIGRISQEHSILTKEGNADTHAELHVGQKVRIWPNHACVAGAGFGWYLIVDSSLPEDQRDKILDVWVRCRGW